MKYEYKIVTSAESYEEDEGMLNELGGEGWELVSVLTNEVSYFDEESEEESEDVVTEVVYYLKRQAA